MNLFLFRELIVISISKHSVFQIVIQYYYMIDDKVLINK